MARQGYEMFLFLVAKEWLAIVLKAILASRSPLRKIFFISHKLQKTSYAPVPWRIGILIRWNVSQSNTLLFQFNFHIFFGFKHICLGYEILTI